MKARTSGKSRLFIGFTAVLLLFIFALFHSSQQQVDELRVAGLKCEQHEMALRGQFESQAEKLTQLETSRNGLTSKLKSEKDLREKALRDANLRFSSLQQHYKSLQTEHEDLQAEYLSSKKSLSDRIKILTSQLADAEKRKESSVAQWKLKYDELEEKLSKLDGSDTKLEANAEVLSIKNQQLTEELNEMRNHCAFRVEKGSGSSVSPPSPSWSGKGGAHEVQRSFDEQVLVSENTYQIPINLQSPAGAPNNINLFLQTSNRTMDLHRDVIPSFSPSSTARNNADAAPLFAKPQLTGIINSVENFQILPKPLSGDNENVLKEPMKESSSTKGSTATLNKLDGDKALEHALPIAPMMPEQSSSVASKAAAKGGSTKSRKVPDGVVPIPEIMSALLNNQEQPQVSQSDIKNARYNNAAEAAAAVDSPILPMPGNSIEQQLQQHNQVHFLQNANEVEENGAHEVNDFNIVEDRNQHDHHLHEARDDEKIVINNNAAEVEAHPEEGDEDKDKRHEIDFAIINRDSHGGVDGVGNNRKEGHINNKQKRGNEEFLGDQGFDDHMEEHVEEEDDDEYPNLAAQQEEGPAVRN